MGMEIEPCPFCGEDEGEIRQDELNYSEHEYFVRCGNCGARGPWTGKGEHHAIALWNARDGEEPETPLSEEGEKERARILELYKSQGNYERFARENPDPEGEVGDVREAADLRRKEGRE